MYNSRKSERSYIAAHMADVFWSLFVSTSSADREYTRPKIGMSIQEAA